MSRFGYDQAACLINLYNSYEVDDTITWYRRTEMPRAAKISFINFKGGVAKTMTSVNFAATLADRGYRVLLADLDPQSNASLWLLGEDRFPARLDEPYRTVYQLFRDRLDGTHHFRFNEAVVKTVAKDDRGHVVTPTLDLLPNTYHAVDLEDRLHVGQGNMDIFKLQMEDIQTQYDFMIFDCAPNLYLTTINALLFSNYFIIPLYPDYFSRVGLIILCREVKRIWDRYGRFSGEDLELLGILISRIKEGATLDKGRKVDLERGLKQLIEEGIVSPNAEMFEPYFNDSVEIPRSVEAFVPTIYYKRYDPRIKTYIDRMNEFADVALGKIKTRFPDIVSK